MDNFIVSARKYRPSTFASVVGQQSITTTLKNAIKNNQLAHAYLFCGPRGVGKTTCARIFAKTINCLNISENYEPCNECESCKAFNESRSYSIHELDAASNNSVDDIRQLNDKVRIPPQVGKYALYIIDEVHMLSTGAFNAFLKTLEEPPEHAIFILATTEKHKIIPTILSRCQIYDFQRIKIEHIVDHLKYVASNEGVEADDAALNIIAQKADGAMRDALSIFDQLVSFSGKQIDYQKVIDNLNVLDYKYYFELTKFFLNQDVRNSLLIFDTILNKGFDGHNFITGLSAHFRDLLVSKDTDTLQLLEVGGEIATQYAEQAKECSNKFLFTALEIANNCDINYKNSKNQRLHVELTLIKLCNVVAEPTEKKNDIGQINTKTKAETKTSTLVEQKTQKTNKQQVNPKTQPKPAVQAKPPVLKSEASHKPIQTTQGFNIKQALQGNTGIKQQAKKETKEDVKQEASPLVIAENKAVNETDLKEAWHKFAEKIKESKPRLYSTLTGQEYVFNAESLSIDLKLENDFQESAFLEIKSELSAFLKQTLSNNKLQINTTIIEVNQNEDRNILYTDSDKYKHLAKKHENLETLRKKFNLDFV